MNYLLEQLEELLPEELTSNNLFSEVWETFCDNLKDNDMILSFNVCSDYYDKLSTLGLNIVKIGKTLTQNNIFYFMSGTSDGCISFRIKYVKGVYDIKFDVVKGMLTNTIVINFDYTKGSVVETISKSETNYNLRSYNYDVYYYDENSKFIRNASEEEKDRNFANEFAVPLKDARNLRKNFQTNSHFLNRNRTISFLDSIERYEHKFNFCSPFILEDLEWFVFDETGREAARGLGEHYESNKDTFKPSGKFDDVKKLFLNVLGPDGKLIISKALYDSLQFYYLGHTNEIVYGNGYIIRKLNDEYTFYTLKIEDNQLIMIPQTLTHDDLQKIYYDCSLNEEVPGLAEFFGIARSR